MSNFQAIATVTATITYLLSHSNGVNGVPDQVPGTVITAKPPDVVVGGAPTDGLNIFLYQVNLNMGYRNLDQPARNSSGDLVNRPRLGLNLHYLITATADGNDDLKSHLILASAMRILHENPVLTNDLIQQVIGASGAPAEIVGSDLDEQIEQVKITPLVLSLEDITKLWSSFFQTNYRVSAAYEATVILLDSALSPKPSLPVKRPQISALPFNVPVIQSVLPQVLDNPTKPLVISGLNLTGDQFQTNVLIDGEVAPFDSAGASSTQISLTVPTTVTPGIKPVQVAMGVIPPSGLPPLPVFKSNVVPFVLAPNIDGGPNFTAPHGGSLLLTITPSLAPQQQVDFLIGDYTVSLAPNAITAPGTTKVTLSLPSGIPTTPTNPPKPYLLRMRVDGAESPLGTDGNGIYNSPTLAVT